MIKIFIGCAPNHDDAESQAVLEYSIRKHASEPVDITWMKLSRSPTSPFYGWDTSTWATPFSGFRYAVPSLCGYKGHAIYMDSDVIVKADVAELAAMRLHGDVMQKNPTRNCVSLWNCERVSFVPFDAIKRGERPDYTLEFFPTSANWNCLDGEDYKDLSDRRIKALHYTSMPHQPHHALAAARLATAGRRHWFDGTPTRHWRADVTELFNRTLAEAIAAGYTIERYCADEPYGDYPKGSVASLRGAVPAWGHA